MEHKSSQRICEQSELGACKASMEAYKLGLAKAVLVCEGRIPPECDIRKWLAAGKTIQELYQK